MSDKRRPDLAINYVHTPDSVENETAGMMAKTLPMMGMFMRSKMISWAGMFVAVQNFMGKSANAEDPGYQNLGSGVISLLMSYADFVYVPKRKAQ